MLLCTVLKNSNSVADTCSVDPDQTSCKEQSDPYSTFFGMEQYVSVPIF